MTPYATMGKHLGAAAAECLRRVLVLTVGVQHKRFVNATARPREIQHGRLRRILRRNIATEYGRKYGFSGIREIKEFQKRVPIADYESLRPYITRMINGEDNVLTSQKPYQYLITSGTSSEPKLVPVTSSFRKEYAPKLQFYYLYREHPEVFRPGAVLSMVSPVIEGWTPCGVPFGSASGLTYITQNALIRKIFAIPYDVYTIKNAADRYYTLLRLALEQDLRLLIMANPSTIVLLASQLNELASELIDDVARGTLAAKRSLELDLHSRLSRPLRPNPRRADSLKQILESSGGSLPPCRVWPNLQAVVCWRDASAALYLPELSKTFDNVAAYNLGYAASEGLGTFRLAEFGVEALAITGHFFEFCEEADIDAHRPGAAHELLLCDELELGKRYHIFLTTSGGLYRYHIDDILEVRGFVKKTPVLQFIQKGTNTFSFTGEKLTETQVIDAVRSSAGFGVFDIAYFCAVPVFDKPPYYQLYLETRDERPDGVKIEELARTLDRTLCDLNVEYAAKRASRRLDPIRIAFLRCGFFAEYSRAAHIAKRAAQIKFKHLNPDALFHQILSNGSADEFRATRSHP